MDHCHQNRELEQPVPEGTALQYVEKFPSHQPHGAAAMTDAIVSVIVTIMTCSSKY